MVPSPNLTRSRAKKTSPILLFSSSSQHPFPEKGRGPLSTEALTPTFLPDLSAHPFQASYGEVSNIFSGKLGSPFAGVAGLVGERVAVHYVPIEHRVEGGKGTLRVGEVVEAEMTPYTDANGRSTTIHDTVFSTIPGSPAYLAKASHHRVNIPEHGMIWEFSGRNAIQGDFHFEA